MDNEDVTLEQMEDTRTSLSEKLETLEQQVSSTVQSATTNVTETIEAVKDGVKDTVESVKETVQETVATVKDTVDQTIHAVKETVREGLTAAKDFVDIPGHVRTNPWLMFGGSIAMGYLLESLFAKAPSNGGRRDGQGKALPPDHVSWEERLEAPRQSAPAFSGFLETFEPEIARLKGLALGTLLGAIRETAIKMFPEKLAPPLTEVLDSAIEKIGGDLPQTKHRSPRN